MTDNLALAYTKLIVTDTGEWKWRDYIEFFVSLKLVHSHDTKNTAMFKNKLQAALTVWQWIDTNNFHKFPDETRARLTSTGFIQLECDLALGYQHTRQLILDLNV